MFPPPRNSWMVRLLVEHRRWFAVVRLNHNSLGQGTGVFFIIITRVVSVGSKN